MTKRAFGELEMQILHILQDKRLTVKDVHRALGGKDNYNTIMTVMNRLTEKQTLSRERHGLQYEYWMNQQAKSPSFFEKIKEKLFGVKTSTVVSYLIDSAEDLTLEDIQQMEKALERAKEEKRKHGQS